MSDREALAAEIEEFLGKHARIAPGFDSALDDPSDRYTGPDSAMLSGAAESLRKGLDAPDVWSSWGSGCYSSIGDREAAAWHDRLIERLREFRPARTPR